MIFIQKIYNGHICKDTTHSYTQLPLYVYFLYNIFISYKFYIFTFSLESTFFSFRSEGNKLQL